MHFLQNKESDMKIKYFTITLLILANSIPCKAGKFKKISAAIITPCIFYGGSVAQRSLNSTNKPEQILQSDKDFVCKLYATQAKNFELYLAQVRQNKIDRDKNYTAENREAHKIVNYGEGMIMIVPVEKAKSTKFGDIDMELEDSKKK